MANGEAIPVLVWTDGDCAGDPGYEYGGWAWLAVQGVSARGAAGGERRTTAGRMALRAMTEALKAVATEGHAPLDLDPGDVGLARIGADLAAREAAGWRTVDGDPIKDADLWREIVAAIRARSTPVRFVAAPATSEPRRFVEAWTAFALDRCKMKGAFTSAIPKPNLQALLAKKARA